MMEQESTTAEAATVKKYDFIKTCNVYVAQEILKNLSCEQLIEVWKGIKRWRFAMQDDFWRIVCKKNNFQELEKLSVSSMYLKFLRKFPHWQGIFWYNLTLRTNITNSNFCQRKLNIENEYLRTLYFDDQHLVASDLSSGNVLVFDSGTGIIKWTCRARPVRHNLFSVNGDNLALATSARYITVWNMKNGIKLSDVQSPKNFPLFCMVLHKNWISTVGTTDSILKIRDIDTNELCYTEPNVCLVCLYDNKAAFLSKDGHLTVINLETQEKFKIKCFGALRDCRIMRNNDTLVCCNNSGEICVFNGRDATKQLMFRINRMCSIRRASILDDHRIAVMDLDRNFQVWDFILGKRLVIVSMGANTLGFHIIGHGNYIFAIINPRGMKCLLNIWCSSTGKLLSTTALKHEWDMYKSSFYATSCKLTYHCYIRNKRVVCIVDYEKIK